MPGLQTKSAKTRIPQSHQRKWPEPGKLEKRRQRGHPGNFGKVCDNVYHRNMRHEVDAHGLLWIVRREHEIERLVREIDEIVQFSPHGFPHTRSLMHISPSRDGTPLQGKLHVVWQENLDAAHRDSDF